MVGVMGLATKAFPCTQCGLCCQNVHMANETRFLDRGDGTCRHYSETRNHCRIYENRPEICRVDRQYELHYANQYSWDEFVSLNIQACNVLAEK
ncbi:MAG: YkgJ family cysteine cluster protein [Pseudomonadota bacterium]|nr:YkgJ family cysteine cluster protein [Pseudomonadota bacterium]